MPYIHALHFPDFWSIFAKYWLEVNGEDLNRISNRADGSVGNKVEDMLIDALGAGHKIKLALAEGFGIAGFIQYKDHGNGELFIYQMCVVEAMRQQGISGLFLKSFKGFSNILFHTHVDTPPKEFLSLIENIMPLGPSSNPRLTLWRGTLKE